MEVRICRKCGTRIVHRNSACGDNLCFGCRNSLPNWDTFQNPSYGLYGELRNPGVDEMLFEVTDVPKGKRPPFINPQETETNMKDKDEIKNPSHYTDQVPGIECKDVTSHFNFNRGNIIKYAWRCGSKGDPIKDLEKIIQYAQFEIDRIKSKKV